ncbi:universal stress protein [Streptomyces sp. H10-C2]|uniref:universal stress protein n=1 Tax=unclassified Streptomyces TaxID=2593676 RepID=UPI0024B9A45C|nr:MULTISPECIES: universal stress protein [unclassified Streptomyces]MDJ0345835.1 universal stress protein [Streptomyces sp. PH10-H1]MDJ0371199.1 universal stress protein [Streptomyces sp. H10-C2]
MVTSATTVTAGLDGSPESLAAAGWAAREALRRGLPLRLVHASTWQPDTETPRAVLGSPGPPHLHWADRVPREAAAELRRRHPDLQISADRIADEPVAALLGAEKDAALLAIGSRGMSGVAGYLVGSVALSVVGRATGPVVLVRAGEVEDDEHRADGSGVPSTRSPYRNIVLGLDLERPSDTLIEFAFDAAARRQAPLRVIHGWYLPAYYSFGSPGIPADQDAGGGLAEQKALALADALRPWREKFPGVEVTAQALVGRAAHHLVTAASGAGLVVVGRRIRAHTGGMHIGSVTHAVMHHSQAPVAVIPHD